MKPMSLTAKDLWRERTLAALFSFAMTLVALPASAGIPIPDDPLTTGARVEPNILFILDDSGSMGWDYMPDGLSSTTWVRRAYPRNTIYYNPYINYEPWIDSSGNSMTGGVSYTAVYTHDMNASGSTTSLQSSNREFYVPKDLTNTSAAYLALQRNYWRYRINTSGRVIRSELLQGDHPVGVSGGGCESGSSGSTWRWKNCDYLTPTGRTEAEVRANFAIWYSYHRTRGKVAKAGAGRAFWELEPNVRVGFRTIHGRGVSGNPITHSKPIPVSRNDGLFDDPEGSSHSATNNRSRWYQRLYASTASGDTPLREALYQAGLYYEDDTTATGPWGPGVGSDQYVCRQNFTILTTDGYRNDGNWSKLGEVDNTNGPLISGPSGQEYQYTPSRPYSSSHSGNLGDIAMHFWRRDLRDDMENLVPTSSNNPAFWQHMVTYGISLGAAGTLDPEADLAALADGTLDWPYHHGYNAGPNDGAESIDDLWHAAVNGRGRFILANDPTEFAEGLRATLQAIAAGFGSYSNVAANSTSLDAGTRLFQARYKAGSWSGTLESIPVSSAGTSDPDWVAAIPSTGRRVYTAAGAFPSSATSEQLSSLERTGGAPNFPVTGEQNAAYVAGDRSLEEGSGGHLRTREGLLGDIVSSSPAYVGDTNTLYVGANDGMLHAFNAANGHEIFSFIPDGISWSDLSSLSHPDYSHRYFVDGPVVVSNRSQTPGGNILVGTLGRGGKGLFALDVTTPSSFDGDDVLWQEYETSGNNMGLILGTPVIAKVKSATATPSTVVLVPNGINSENNRAVLLVYDLESGDLIKEIDTGEGSVDHPNGLSGAVGWDANADGVVDAVYAGDMLGNVWKFDFSGEPDSWQVANDSDPMFIATDDDVNRQPVSARLTVGLHPANFTTWIFFGTGRFLSVGDVTDHSVQSLYGIMDRGDVVSKGSLIQRHTVIAGFTSGYPVRAFENASPLPLEHPDGGAVEGWYIDLLEPPPGQAAVGERVVSEVQVVNRVLVVATVIPTDDACRSGGRGYLNALDAFTGASLSGGSYFDLDGDGDFSDEVVGDGDDAPPVGSVDLGVGMPTLPNLLDELAGVGGTLGTGTVNTMDPRFSGRVSWREEVEE